MKLIANRQLYNPKAYGTVATGQTFECPDEVARELLKNGLARKAEPPRILYETKVITPPEVGPAVPFCDVSVPDQEPPTVAKESDPMLSESSISNPEAGASDSGGRRGRFGLRKRGRPRKNPN